MPELPDITVYIEALEERILGQRLERIRLATPFLLRTVDPPISATAGRVVEGFRRLGKRIAIELDGDIWIILHLMIAGRLHWKPPKSKIPGGRRGLAAFDFPNGTLILTEAGSKKRAALCLAASHTEVNEHDPGGLEVLASDYKSFAAAITAANHTLKRALTDPRILSGIGNAYSDEILHRARLSPVTPTQKLSGEQLQRLFDAARETLLHWIEQLRADRGSGFPEKVTAFRKRDGGSRPLRGTLPRLWREDSAHSIRGERNKLLRGLPNRRQVTRGPVALPIAQERLAANRGAA